MYKKASEKQGFKTADLALVLGLVVAVVVISGSILKEALVADPGAQARFGAETLAHQMAASASAAVGKLESSTNRGPASVAQEPLPFVEGKLGKDPWGEAYLYKVFRNDGLHIKRVVVWSMGADRKPDSVTDDSSVHFKGDDIGYIYEPSH